MGVEFGYMHSDVSGLLVDAKYILEEVSKNLKILKKKLNE